MTRLAYNLRLMTLAASAFVVGCGGTGESEPKPCLLCGAINDVRGSIASQNGSQLQMQGWVVASFEHDTNIARVGEVDAAGLYQLSKIRTDVSQTLALLSPDYILQAVLSIPNTPDNKTIKQFINIKSPYLPRIIHKGPIITLQDYTGITVAKDLASDVDGDGIPDGSVSLGAGKLGLLDPGFNLLQGAAIDIDLDGTPNERDPDIDGDGIINVIDPDDNGNGILDVFDGDANGDLEPDTAPGQKDTDLYFKEGVEYVAVQFQMRPKTDGSGTNETVLNFTTKVRDNVTPLAVQIRGAPSLLNGALIVAKDQNGADTYVAWNRLLGDDGYSNDDNPNDRLFAQRVILENAKAPRAHEVVFFQLAFGSLESPWYLEFPYSFPDVKPSAVTAAYDANTRTVLLVGNPFKDIQDFIWMINVYDSEGQNIWTSQAIPGTTRQFQVQENVLVTDATYKYEVVAQTLDKIPGRPSYTVFSQQYDLK